MDIRSGNKYPSCALSNFAPHPFEIDGVRCASMEGFLQSLKFEKPHIQENVCGLIGREAKRRGKYKSWHTTQTLWWKGVPYARKSAAYTALIKKAYKAMHTQSDSFRRALAATGDASLTHSIGGRKKAQTILTQSEFCGILTELRTQAPVAQ